MDFRTYKKLIDPDVAKSIIDILKKNNIAYLISEERSNLDSLYGGD
ncbi:hypothetical protein QQ008_13080 [Fulvivirgaceae bacterium BMA10]|uniref:Uncharacterized protein n=1 Tax=Splendidivirga corallicola TaxID=3051826 RepID=A0ABT8KNL7_9BACT|nr:hypothetical protein [Fulvivirgaceae bacterium BMA10]